MSRNYCLNCGNELKHNDFFCSKCGTENPHIKKDPVLKRRTKIQNFERQDNEPRVILSTYNIIQLSLVVLTGVLIIVVALLNFNESMFFSAMLSIFWFSIAFSMYKGKRSNTHPRQDQIGIITLSVFTFFASFITTQFGTNTSFQTLYSIFHTVLIVVLVTNLVLAIIARFRLK